MNKALIIKTTGETEVKDLSDPIWMAINDTIKGYFEVVRVRSKKSPVQYPLVMIVDEDGLSKRLGYNKIASGIYTHSIIVGDVIIMKEGMTDEGPDLIGLTDEDIEGIKERLGVK